MKHEHSLGDVVRSLTPEDKQRLREGLQSVEDKLRGVLETPPPPLSETPPPMPHR